MFALMFTLMSMTLIVRLLRGFLGYFGIVVIYYTSVSIVTCIRGFPWTLGNFCGFIGVLFKDGALFNDLLFGFGAIFVHAHGRRGVMSLRSSMANSEITHGNNMTVASIKVT